MELKAGRLTVRDFGLWKLCVYLASGSRSSRRSRSRRGGEQAARRHTGGRSCCRTLHAATAVCNVQPCQALCIHKCGTKMFCKLFKSCICMEDYYHMPTEICNVQPLSSCVHTQIQKYGKLNIYKWFKSCICKEVTNFEPRCSVKYPAPSSYVHAQIYKLVTS